MKDIKSKVGVYLASAILSVMFICCAVNPEIGQVTQGTPLGGDYYLVWDSILEVFAENNIPISTLDEEAGIISSDWIVLSERHNENCDCGGRDSSPLDVVQAKFNVFVEFITEGSTGVKMAALFQQKDKICRSTGKFESDLLLSIENKIRSFN